MRDKAWLIDRQLRQLNSFDITLNLALNPHIVEAGASVCTSRCKKTEVRNVELLGELCKDKRILIVHSSEDLFALLGC